MHTLLKNNSLEPSPTVIALLRHGKTIWNEVGRIQGRMDSPLSTKGARQVHKWAQFLSDFTINQIVASDLGRVRETVAILQQYCNSVPVEWKKDLREQSWGKWEGKTFQELQREDPETLATNIRAGWEFRPPGGESRKEVLQRAFPIIQDTLYKYHGKQILIVSHEGIIKSIIYHLANRAFLPEEKKLLHKRQLHLLVNTNNTLSLGPLNVFPDSMDRQP